MNGLECQEEFVYLTNGKVKIYVNLSYQSRKSRICTFLDFRVVGIYLLSMPHLVKTFRNRLEELCKQLEVSHKHAERHILLGDFVYKHLSGGLLTM